MKKLLTLCFIATTTFVLYSCGGSGNSNKAATTDKPEEAVPTVTDFKMLGNEAEFKKVYNMAIDKLGDNIKHVSEITFRISEQLEGGDEDDGDTYLTIMVQYLHPKNSSKLEEYSYWSSSGKWADSPTTVTVTPIGDPEDFRLQDYLMDLSSLTFEKVNKAAQDVLAKHKDDEKYLFQYIDEIRIEEGEITVIINGKLRSNELMKTEISSVSL